MMKQFTELELANQNYLNSCGVSFVTVRLTENILKHSIFDASLSIRAFLKEKGIHDFTNQINGQGAKRKIKTHILTFNRDLYSQTSLYRAGTRGDCRMWFGSAVLPISDADDLYAITAINQELYIVNLSKINIESCYQTSFPSPIQQWLKILKCK